MLGRMPVARRRLLRRMASDQMRCQVRLPGCGIRAVGVRRRPQWLRPDVSGDHGPVLVCGPCDRRLRFGRSWRRPVASAWPGAPATLRAAHVRARRPC